MLEVSRYGMPKGLASGRRRRLEATAAQTTVLPEGKKVKRFPVKARKSHSTGHKNKTLGNDDIQIIVA